MSDVLICNDALGMIGKGDINSLEEAEPAARQCKKYLPTTLRELQARYDWAHNIKVVDIAANAAASTLPGFQYVHKLPPDYIRFSAVCSTDAATGTTLDATFSPVTGNFSSYDILEMQTRHRETPVPFKVAAGAIHTNFTPLRLIYHRNKTETSDIPEMFRMALVAQLAAKLVMPLTRDTKLSDQMYKKAADALVIAQDDEDKDELFEAPQGSSFEDARR